MLEGPTFDPTGGLFFSDVPNGGVYRLDLEHGTIDVIVPKRRGVGGIARHADGGIVISGRDISHVRDGVTRIVFAPDAPGLNDLTVDAEGRVICGTIRSDPFDLEAERTSGEAYLVGPDDVPTEIYGGVGLTNGMGFSPDGATFYHADSTAGHIITHRVEDGRFVDRGALTPGGRFTPDGLAVDTDGVVWVADVAGGCVRAVDPTGGEVDRVDVPSTAVTSVCFGGDDGRDLYIVTADNTAEPDRAGSIFRTRVETPGLPVPLARV
ncbi:MAG: SMP-30/gluconolactonase/LRE family protein [Acidimicrobiales bacterium]